MGPIPFLGIDFGTSKSSMAWYDPRIGRAQIILNREGQLETPSVVYIGPGENNILVGEPAELKLKQRKVDQRRFVLSIKRDLLKAAPKILPEGVYTPVQIASFILRKLREDAEQRVFNGQAVTHVVITHPAKFGTNQKDKIRDAALLAGFREVQLLSEPEAAALAYGYAGSEIGKSLLVYDFGGGTFDVAVLERTFDGSFGKTVARDGLERCGGDDLDLAIYLYCEEIARQEKRRSISLTEEPHLRFLRLCRECKHNLTSQPDYIFSDFLDSQNGQELFEYTFERSTFEDLALVQDIVGKTVAMTQEVIHEAAKSNCQVETVVLIGGSSQVPLVKNRLTTALSIQPHEWEHQYTAVSLGAAYHAQQLWGTPPPPSKQEEYRKDVKSVPDTQTLTQAQVDWLNTRASQLRLTSEEATAIEREIMGASKEEIWQHQLNREAYRKAVRGAWSNRTLTQARVDELNAQAFQLLLSSYEAATVECEIMGAAKEEILQGQKPKPPKKPEFTPQMRRVRKTRRICALCVWVGLATALLAWAIGSSQPSAAVVVSFIFILGLVLLVIGWVIALVNTTRIARWGWFVSILLFGLLVVPLLIYTFVGPLKPPVQPIP